MRFESISDGVKGWLEKMGAVPSNITFPFDVDDDEVNRCIGDVLRQHDDENLSDDEIRDRGTARAIYLERVSPNTKQAIDAGISAAVANPILTIKDTLVKMEKTTNVIDALTRIEEIENQRLEVDKEQLLGLLNYNKIISTNDLNIETRQKKMLKRIEYDLIIKGLILLVLILSLFLGRGHSQSGLTGLEIQDSAGARIKLWAGGIAKIKCDATLTCTLSGPPYIVTFAAAGGGSGTVTNTLGALILNQLTIGNGGNDIKTFAPGAADTVLISGTPPTWGKIANVNINITAITCTNQFLSALSASLGGTCTTATLASAQFANQGTTTTVLHGNGAGNPSFAAVTSADTTGTFPATAHNLLSATHGDTSVGTVVRGDMIIGNSTPAWARLGIGTRKTVPQVTKDGLDIEFREPQCTDVSTFCSKEEFVGGGSSISGTLGSEGWTLSTIGTACTVGALAGAYPNIGQMQVSTSATASTGCGMILQTVQSSTSVPLGDLKTNTLWSGDVIFRPNGTTNERLRIGIFATIAAKPNDWAGARYDTNAGVGDAAWHLCASTGGTETCDASTVAISTTLFRRLHIESIIAGTWTITMFDETGAALLGPRTFCAAACNNTMTPPTSTMWFGAIIGNDVTASAITIRFDMVLFKYWGLAR